MSVHTRAYKTDPHGVDLWCYGPFFMVTAVGFGLYPCRWSHQAMFAQGLVLPRRWWQPFLFNDLPTRLGHPDNSRHRSAVMRKRCFCDCCSNRDAVFLELLNSDLSGTRPAGTPSSCRSLCWSHTCEGDCIKDKRWEMRLISFSISCLSPRWVWFSMESKIQQRLNDKGLTRFSDI